MAQHVRQSIALAFVACIAACENPQPPASCGSIPEQTLFVGESATVDVCFDDPNGEMLTFAVATSDPAVATAVVSGSRVTVTAASPGVAVVTMTATDPGGLKAQQSFRVMVPNRPPSAVGTIEDRELMVGDSTLLDASAYFSEPDGQALSYTVAVSDSSRLTASAERAVVTLVAVARGTVTVTVTATDPGGLTGTHSFQVKVPNRAPVAVGSIAARTIEVERTDTLDVSAYFADPDGDMLSYAADVSDSSVVAAAVSGGTVTVTALAKGEAVVTVTATDDEGLGATQSFHVTVPNQPPRVADTIPALVLFKNEADTLELASYFSDPDGDVLVYGAEASKRGVVAVAVSGGILTVRALGQGETEVTVTAIDTEGLAARQSFQVTVANRAPVVSDTIPAQTLHKGETAPVDLTRHFHDPDGDALEYVAGTTDNSVATGVVSGGRLTVKAGAIGEATITVTAADPGGLVAEQSFLVTVLNRAPVATETIPHQMIATGRSETLEMSTHFDDPDGDMLTFAATTSRSSVASVRVSGSKLTVRGVASGEAEVTVTATDTDGASAVQSFKVTVERRAMDFDITVGFGPGMTASQERAFRTAASYWMSSLRFTDLPDLELNMTFECTLRGVTAEVQIGSLDDVGLVVAVADLDGLGGTLAAARLCLIRTRSETPVLGMTVFDRADIDRLEQTGSLVEVAVHEMAHILGFGLLWPRRGLLKNPSRADPDADTHFTGARAIAAFDDAGGASYPGAKVPVENGGDDAHWRKSVFDHELMTSSLVLGQKKPLSAITLQSFADMGYSIDASEAQAYRLPSTARVADIAAGAETQGTEILGYGDDIERGPITVVDIDGKVVKVIGEESTVRRPRGPVIRVILKE